MDKDIKKLKKLVDFMRKQGVLTVKLDEMEIQLSPGALFPHEASETPESPDKQMQAPDLTYEELALWSAPGATFQS